MTLREEFCPACIAPVIIAAGAVGVGFGSKSKDKIITTLYISNGISLIVGAIGLFLYYKFLCESCKRK